MWDQHSKRKTQNGKWKIVAFGAQDEKQSAQIVAFYILKLIMREGLFIFGVGVVIGLLTAIAGGRLIASLMFGNSGTDLSVYVALSVLLIAVAMLALGFLCANSVSSVSLWL